MRLHYYPIHRIVIKQYIGEPAVVCLMKIHSRLESCNIWRCCRCAWLYRTAEAKKYCRRINNSRRASLLRNVLRFSFPLKASLWNFLR